MAGIPEPCPDPVHPITVLGLPELALYRIPFPRPYVVFHCPGRGPAQELGRQLDPLGFKPFPVFPAAVQFIGQNLGRIKAKALPVVLHIIGQVAAFMVGVPGNGVQKGISVYQQKVDLRPKLGFVPGLAPDYRADMGLVDTHDPVLHTPRPVIEHLLLLEVQCLDDPIIPLPFMGQGKYFEPVQLAFYGFQVTPEVLELGLDALSDRFTARVPVLGHFKVVLTGLLTIGSRLLALRKLFVEQINDRLALQAGIIEQVQIDGVGNVLQTGRGINQQLPLMGAVPVIVSPVAIHVPDRYR